MKKFSSILFAALILLSLVLSGCGSAEPSPYDGRWIAVGAEAQGVKMPLDPVGPDTGFIMDIEGVGKVKLTIDGSESNQKWAMDGDKFILTIDGTETAGTVDGDLMAFENMLDTGATMYFAREGSAAANPENFDNTDELLQDYAAGGGEIQYLPVKEDSLIGTWTSMGYSMAEEDPVEHDPELIGLTDIAQLLEISFKEDKTLHFVFNNAQAVNDYNWHIEGSMMVVESPDLEIKIYYRSDDVLEVILENPETYMEIYCKR